ncbi:DNA-binding NarL/FixJ family response regulator [Arthrobacter sp. V4I6]|nr:DNA-binding NarL/FixJ family response regulator [Arthrobacter sp. V1I7]MDQ0853089.1 DNA-binding NarL/FixJ family response regulator [Arthrobacter sp. V4I6]
MPRCAPGQGRTWVGEPVDVVLMDLQMGTGMDGVTATGRIKAGGAGQPAPPVLILTTYDSDADILAAVEAGASGYMLKDPRRNRSARRWNGAIAKQLFISEATVKTHLVHIYGKLDVDNRTAAISVAAQHRIIRRF